MRKIVGPIPKMIKACLDGIRFAQRANRYALSSTVFFSEWTLTIYGNKETAESIEMKNHIVESLRHRGYTANIEDNGIRVKFMKGTGDQV